MGIKSGDACLRLLLMIAWFNSFNSIWPLSLRTHKDRDIIFNRNITGVYFDPSDFKMYNALPQTRDEYALVTLLKVIHTRFDKVLVTLHVPHRRDGDISNDLLPDEVAKYNQFLNESESSTASHKLKIDIMCKEGNWGDDRAIIQPRLKEIKKVMDVANLIYPGTVNSVILEIADLNEKSIKNFKTFLTEFGTEIKVGIKLKLETCVNASLSESSISKTLMNDLLNDNYLETVLFEENFDRTTTSVSVSQALKVLQSQVERCKELVHELNKKIELALITTWCDTDDQGREKFSKFVDFWVQVNKWAVASNTSVIFRQAFDTPLATGTLVMKTNGWWKLIPNSSYLQPSQFVFEEKALIIRSDMTNGKLGADQITWLGQSTEFSRSVVGVHFDPFVLNLGLVQSVSENETSLHTPIQQISTKFSKILMSTILSEYDLSDRYLNMRKKKQKLFSAPSAVAMWNKNQSRDAKKSMEVILTFDETSSGSVLQSAADANKLFPGTVTQLIYSLISTDEDKFLDGYSAFVKISNQTNSLGFGIKIKLELCFDHLELRTLMKLLQDYFFDDLILNVIYFEALVTPEPSKLRSDRLLPLLTVMFENCKNTLDDYLRRYQCKEKLQVAFITGWPITSEETLEGLMQLTTFWEGINAWASTTNTTVIIYSAFDPITSSTSSTWKRESKYGWWSVQHDFTLGEQYSFENKKIAAFRYASEKLDNDLNDSSQLITVILASVGAVIAIVVVALLAVFYLLKRRQSKILTKAEIVQFLNGGDINVTGSPESMNGPYQKLHLELPTKSFTINEGSPLGSGAYGKVCLGIVTRDGGVEEEVAVKMTKVPSTGFALRGLLFEIKILSYLGMHPHVVGLVGAYTAELRRRKIYVFLELCGLGSLQSLLRKYGLPSKQDSDDGPEQFGCEEGRLELDDVLINDMARWSSEIANGMEFIASKHIVHLDLATRNVLLTSEKRAKITDFGLSRRMYEYQSYIKKHQEPLPWRSMAPESLRRSEFTEKSDVWAFGILLWEIYSLGDEPYPGLYWEVNFPTKLERGLRPGEPVCNQNSMYSIMLRCWTTNPAGRPTFSELVTYLSPAMVEAGPSGSTTIREAPFYENLKISESTFKIPFTRASAGDVGDRYNSSFPKSMAKICPVVLRMWLTPAVILLLIFFSILIWTPWMIGDLDSLATSSNGGGTPAPAPIGSHMIVTTNQTSYSDDRNDLGKVTWSHSDSGLARECMDRRNKTALGHKLFIAICGRGNKEEAVFTLVQRGADVNVRDELGQTPLIATANCSNDKNLCLKIAKFLIENGANVKAENNKGETFLYNLVSEPGAITPSQFHQIADYLASKNMSKRLADWVLYKNDDMMIFPLWCLAVWNIDVENRTLSLLSTTIANFHYELKVSGPQILAMATTARRGPQLLSFLIEQGANWRHLFPHNASLLHYAALECNPDGVNFYFNKGLDINAPMEYGFTALHYAALCETGNMLETIRVLIDNRADVNAKVFGATPLAFVTELGSGGPDHHKVVKLLRDAELAQDQAHHRQIPGESKMELDQLFLDYLDQQNGYTIRGLVKSGVDLNKKDSQHITPLIRLAKTCRGTCFRFLEYLIINGADVYAEDMSGHTFLYHLIAHEVHALFTKHRNASAFHQIVLFAVRNNVSKLFNVKEGKFPHDSLIQWVLKDTKVDIETLTLLYQNGVDFSTKNSEGNSVLSSAVNKSWYDFRYGMQLISNLMEFGVDWSGVYYRSRSLLHSSARAGNTEAVKLFLNKSLDVNAQDSDGETPLHLAVRDVAGVKLLEVVQLLIENGANVTIRNDQGKIPFSTACDRKLDIEVIQMLKVVDCDNALCHPTKYGYCGDGETAN